MEGDLALPCVVSNSRETDRMVIVSPDSFTGGLPHSTALVGCAFGAIDCIKLLLEAHAAMNVTDA